MTKRSFAFAVWGLAASLFAAGQLARAAGLAINHTASAPLGLWRIEPLTGVPERGRMVSVCPPDDARFRLARERGYLRHGRCPGGYEPMLKPAAAIEGDLVELTPEGLSVNGRRIVGAAPRAADGAGRAMPPAPLGAHVVGPGEVWLASSFNPASFDSRYFGPLPLAQIEGAATPLWTSTARSLTHGE